MKDWQAQAMWEADAAAEWERINEPDPAEKELKEAAKSIEIALDCIDSGLDWISDAVSKLDGSPMADKVQSFLDSFESLANNLEKLGEHYGRGERE